MKDLKNYNLKELKDLRNRIDYEINLKTPKPEEELFYYALNKIIKKNTGLRIIPFPVFKLNKNYPKFKKVLLEIDRFFEDNLGKELTRVEKSKVYNLYADLIYGYTSGMGITTILPTLINFHEYFPGLLEKEFPGYLKSGLLRKIL